MTTSKPAFGKVHQPFDVTISSWAWFTTCPRQGPRLSAKGPAAWILGNWRVSSVNLYSSGQPVGLSTSYNLPLFNGRSTPYVVLRRMACPNERRQLRSAIGQFLRSVRDRSFPTQGLNTPLNSLVIPLATIESHLFPNLNAPSPIRSRSSHCMEFRAGAFLETTRPLRHRIDEIQSQNFGHLTSSGDLLNAPRQLQLALKLYF